MADASDDLGDRVSEIAQNPQSATSDGQSVTMPKVDDVIKADKYLRQKEAEDKAHRGLRITKLKSPGTV